MPPAMRDVVQRGLWFEEFEEGVRYLHRPGRTVTEADNVLFTTLTMNPQPLHLDAAWSAEQPFGQRLVNSLFTLSTLVGQSVGQLTQGTLVANLGFGDVAFPHPVFDRRHALRRERRRVQARVRLPARAGRRDARAHGAQPGRRRRRDRLAHDARLAAREGERAGGGRRRARGTNG